MLFGPRQAFKLVVAVAEADDWVRLMIDHMVLVGRTRHTAAGDGSCTGSGTGCALEQLRVSAARVLVALYYVAVHAFFNVVRARGACNVLVLVLVPALCRADKGQILCSLWPFSPGVLSLLFVVLLIMLIPKALQLVPFMFGDTFYKHAFSRIFNYTF